MCRGAADNTGFFKIYENLFPRVTRNRNYTTNLPEQKQLNT